MGPEVMFANNIRLILLAIGLHFVLCIGSDVCVVEINSKQISGRSRRIADGVIVCEYTNIPYAMKIQRFERASLKPIDKLSKKNFKNIPKECIQGSRRLHVGQEDCLFLNVYQLWHNNETDKLHPVLVYIHGGTFNAGSPQKDINDVDEFLKEDIIFVTINYRLGLFGFSSLPNGSIEANLGLTDQQLALEWIQRFIHYFKGDCQQVTVLGWSAGAAAVSYHLYLSTSRDLFQRTIIVSGSFLNPWGFNPHGEKCFLTLCDKLNVSNCTKSTLAKLSSHELFPPFSMDMYIYHFGIMYSCFLPTVGNEANILVKPPHLLAKGKPINEVPVLMGYTSLEECCDIDHAREFSMKDYVFPYSNVNVSQLFGNVLNSFMMKYSIDDIAELRRMGDMHYGILKLAEHYSLSAKSPLYMYRFASSLNTRRQCALREKGALHGDDINLLFKKNSTVHIKKLAKLRLEFIELWVHFIKYGNFDEAFPKSSVQWPPYDPVNRTILNIGGKLIARKQKLSNLFYFWENFQRCIETGECTDFQ